MVVGREREEGKRSEAAGLTENRKRDYRPYMVDGADLQLS